MRPSSAASCSKGRSSSASPAMNTGCTPTCAVRRSDTGTPAGSSGSEVASRPRPATLGVRPVAASSHSKRSSSTVPSARVARTTTVSPSRTGSSWRAPSVSGSSFAKTSRATACSAGSLSGPTWSLRPYSRTRTPRRCSACAISSPITPAPTTATERGSVVHENTSSLTIRRSPSRCRQPGGTAGREPVAMTMRAASTRVCSSTCSTPSATKRARPCSLCSSGQ